MTAKKSHGEKVRNRIIAAGVTLWPNVSARAIAAKIGLTHSGILYHFEDANAMLDAIAAHAVENGNSRVIAQLITSRHPAVASMSQRERRQHLAAACG